MIDAPALLPAGVIITDGVACDGVLFSHADDYFATVTALKNDGFEMCIDVCGVDYLEHPDRWLPEGIVATRFEVVVNLLSLSRKQRVRVRVQAGNDAPRVDSLFALYPGTEAPEREVFDMFGILFDGHPDLTRILMPEEWEGHPLRKDFGVGRVPVQFKEGPGPR
jgi:NADH-quinone oxidoreductase subunit C